MEKRFYISLKIGIDLWESKSVLKIFCIEKSPSNFKCVCVHITQNSRKMNENSIDSSPLSWSAEILQTRYDAQYSKNGETSQK